MLTDEQIQLLRSAGQEVAIRHGDHAMIDYNFELAEDWAFIREVAISAGIDWAPDAEQPVDQEVWTHVYYGYDNMVGF